MALTKGFREAVAERNVALLRTYIANSMRADPTFQSKTCDDYYKHVLAQKIPVDEPYCVVEGEEALPDEALWDQSLFYKQLVYLKQNFAYKERRPIIEKIGKKVFAIEKKQASEVLFAEAPQGCRSNREKTSPILIVAVAAVAAVGIIVFLLLK